MFKPAIRFLVALALVSAGFAMLVLGMGRATSWLASREERAVAGVGPTDTRGSSPRLEAGQEDAPPATSAPTGRAGSESPYARAVHSLAEWPSERPREFHEAPLLKPQVARGALPPVGRRLPEDPLVIVPPEQMGPYGGSWTRLAQGSQNDIELAMEARLANEGLMRWDATGTHIVPNLATRWEVSEDGRAFTFWLRKGVKWSDGEPFTAEDVRFWFEDVIGNESITPILPPELNRRDDRALFEKIDDHTVRFQFRRPNGLFLLQMASGFSAEPTRFAAHYLKRFHARYAPVAELEKMARDRGLAGWPQLFEDRRNWRGRETPRLWAWIVKETPPAVPVVFERNPYYWKVDPDGNQLPYIDRVTFEVLDGNMISLRAMNGEIGMQERYISLQDYPLLMENRARGRYRVLRWQSASGGTNIITLNQNHKDPVLRRLIQDRRFRFALSHAIDRDEINRLVFFGLGEPRQVSPLPGSPYYYPDLATAHLEFDPARANRSLDEMGLDKRGPNGIRLRPDGRPLKLCIESWGGRDMPALELVAQDWRAVGVQTEAREQARDLFNSRHRAALQDAAVRGSDDDIMPILAPIRYIPISEDSFFGANWGRWHATGGARGEEPPEEIKQALDLFRRIEESVDDREQKDLFRQILEINRENLWLIGTVGGLPQLVVAPDKFRNVPEVAAYSWTVRSPSNTAPECYAIAGEGSGSP